MSARRHQLRAADGQALVVMDTGPEDGHAVVIAGHAMMVDRRTLLREDRPCLAAALGEAGFRVLVPDLRGHGESGPRAEEGGDWSYEDSVDDVGQYLALAEELAPGRPVFLLGHSLFGHVALAYLAQHPGAEVAGVVAVAVDVWQGHNEPSALHWGVKVVVLGVSSVVAKVVGRLPVRAARVGTNDEAATYWASFWPLVRRGWRTPSGISRQAMLSRIRCPVLHVVSDGDRLYARPGSALAFSAAIVHRTVLIMRDGPDHMGVVTDPASAPTWEDVASWLKRHAHAQHGAARRGT